MSRNRKFSRSLLVVEALLLIIPSLFGFLLFGSFLLRVFSGSNDLFANVFGLLPFLSFFSFWHLMTDVLNEEFVNGKKMSRFIRIFCGMGILGPIASLFFIDNPFIKLPIWGFGIVYVPTFIHMLCEAKRQKSVYLNKNRKFIFME